MTWSDVHYKKLTVPAWVECRHCNGGGEVEHDEGYGIQDCPVCNGEGGKWHEAVKDFYTGDDMSSMYIKLPGGGVVNVTRSTILFQLYDPCGECGGKGWTGPRAGYCGDICPFCLRDSDGNPTGAAEGTGQGWKIEEDEK